MRGRRQEAPCGVTWEAPSAQLNSSHVALSPCMCVWFGGSHIVLVLGPIITSATASDKLLLYSLSSAPGGFSRQKTMSGTSTRAGTGNVASQSSGQRGRLPQLGGPFDLPASPSKLQKTKRQVFILIDISRKDVDAAETEGFCGLIVKQPTSPDVLFR